MFENQKKEWREQAEQRGIEKGIEQRRKEGEEAKNLEVIKEGLEAGLSLTILSKLTKKTIEEIEELINKHKLT